MSTTITVVGVGALGSHLVQFLRSMDVTLRVCDFDRVEQKNTLSQFHSKTAVGRSKVQSLQQTMQFLWGLKLQTIPHELTKNNQREVLGNSDLIVDCLDNGEARRLIQGYVREHKVPCLHGGLAGDGAFGLVLWDEDFKIDDEPGEGAATCEDGEHLPFIGLVAAFMARSIQEYLQGDKKIGFQIAPTGAIRT